MEKMIWLKAEKIIQEVARICHSFHAKEVTLYGPRVKGTAQERSDIDIVNMDTCRNQLLLEDIRQYGRKIWKTFSPVVQFIRCTGRSKAEGS